MMSIKLPFPLETHNQEYLSHSVLAKKCDFYVCCRRQRCTFTIFTSTYVMVEQKNILGLQTCNHWCPFSHFNRALRSIRIRAFILRVCVGRTVTGSTPQTNRTAHPTLPAGARPPWDGDGGCWRGGSER